MSLEQVGVVAIGRNEGERLQRCLRAVVGRVAAVVYVDSGSTDGSVAFARSLGVVVVDLDTSRPFTAARARNTGCERLVAAWPALRYVQFLDGDCEVVAGWLEAAWSRLDAAPHVVAVCGRRRERFPGASLYNRLIDMEWNTPIGVARATGGDAMFRLEAFRAVGGFDPSMICGEEPELCYRLRQRGGVIERLDQEMTLHDAALDRFGQWWQRTVRAGWALAEGAARYGQTPERYNLHRSRSSWIWGALIPALSCALAFPSAGLAPLLALAGYVTLWVKVTRDRLTRGDAPLDGALYAAFTVVGKLPEALGQSRYWLTRLRGQQATLIEYKQPAPAPG